MAAGVSDRPEAQAETVLSGVVHGVRFSSRDGLTRAVLLLLVLGRTYQTLMPVSRATYSASGQRATDCSWRRRGLGQSRVRLAWRQFARCAAPTE